MQKLIYSLLLIALAFLVYSCGPMKVTSNIMKQYPAYSENTPVEVYFSQAAIPSASEPLGLVEAKDSGLTSSNKCDSITAVEHLKNEARKVGGNAVYVSRYTKPSASGSSCHQMTGTVLRVSDFTSFDDDDAGVEYDETQFQTTSKVFQQKGLPRYRLEAKAGYGWRLAGLGATSGAERELFKSLKNGWGFLGSFTCYYNDFHGVEVLYGALTGNAGAKPDYNTIEGSSLLNYIGLAWTARQPIQGNWIMDMRVGLGYADYKISVGPGFNFDKQGGWTIGTDLAFGLDYRINDYLGVDAEFSIGSGLVNSIYFEKNGRREKLPLKGDERVGLGNIKLLLGLNYYF